MSSFSRGLLNRTGAAHSVSGGLWQRTYRFAVFLLVLPSSRPVVAKIDCSQAPNCTNARRMPCNVNAAPPLNVDNTCGDCFEGYHGGFGPTTTTCLTNQSCVLIFPGQTACPEEGASSSLPFPIPFGRCACDRGGQWWATAKDKCATAVVTEPTGSGNFVLYQCPDSRCELSTCMELAMWPSTQVPYACMSFGADSFLLSDSCLALRGEGRPAPLSAFCGHNGLVSKGEDDGVTVPSLPMECELAPQCPYTVLHPSRTVGRDRLDQSCCTGNPDSHPTSATGHDTDVQAQAFCSPAAIAGTTDFFISQGSQVLGCPVRTSGPGWRGCQCLDDRGLPAIDRVCTVECLPPACPLPEDGVIPATPERWLTSKVPDTKGPETIPVANAAVHWHGVVVRWHHNTLLVLQLLFASVFVSGVGARNAG